MLPFVLAAALAALWFFVHLIAGGRQIAAPLRAAPDLAPLVRDTQYLCWHLTSAAIAAMALFFALGAVMDMPAYGIAGTVLAAAFTLVGVALVQGIGQSHARMPQGWLFLPVTALGLWGCLA